MEEDEVKAVGFWWSEFAQDLPKPVANDRDMVNGPIFRTALTMLQMRMSNSNGYGLSRAREPNPVGQVIQYKGFSHCRICGNANGSQTFILDGFSWPSGYLHYLSEHFVRPDPAFEQFVKDWARNNILVDGKCLIV
jgi:hypothetical protein